MMEKRAHYLIQYRDIAIGDLYISAEGRYRFIPIEGAPVPENAFIFHELRADTGWRDPMPFFADRIRNAGRFDPDPDVIDSHIDHYRMVRVREQR